MVVLDTHTLIWWTLDPAKLSDSARQVCNNIPQTGGIVSSILLWEIGLKVKRGQLDLGLDMEDYVGRLHLLKGLEIVAVDVEHWLENLRLPWDHPDPADRTIVATAQLLDASLVSKDEVIRSYYNNTIW